MKKKEILKIVLVCWITLILIITDIYSQPPAPPDGHGLNGNQGPGGMAPIDGGIIFMLLSSVFYGGIKIYKSIVKYRSKSE